MAAGDAAAGKAKAAVCGACHGADGNSAAPTFPKLAGQNVNYLLKQMHAIKSGERKVPQMAGLLDGKSEQDLEDIAAYFSSQTRTIQQAKPKNLDLGERIYRAGLADKGVPACSACHSPHGNGNGPAGFPVIGGQYAEYIEAQLKAYRLGHDQPDKGRTTDGQSHIMRSVAYNLSDLEIEAVANYISGLH